MTFRPARIIPEDREALRRRALQDALYSNEDFHTSAPLTTMDPASVDVNSGTIIFNTDTMYLKRLSVPRHDMKLGAVRVYAGSITGNVAVAIYKIIPERLSANRQSTAAPFITAPKLVKVWSKTFSLTARPVEVLINPPGNLTTSALSDFPASPPILERGVDYVLGFASSSAPSSGAGWDILTAHVGTNIGPSYATFNQPGVTTNPPDSIDRTSVYFANDNVAFMAAVWASDAVGTYAKVNTSSVDWDGHIW